MKPRTALAALALTALPLLLATPARAAAPETPPGGAAAPAAQAARGLVGPTLGDPAAAEGAAEADAKADGARATARGLQAIVNYSRTALLHGVH